MINKRERVREENVHIFTSAKGQGDDAPGQKMIKSYTCFFFLDDMSLFWVLRRKKMGQWVSTSSSNSTKSFVGSFFELRKMRKKKLKLCSEMGCQ